MKRNGTIELFRFIFCIIILLFHVNYFFFNEGLMIANHITLFLHGYIGVEFFFLVSGYLMAKSVMKPIGDIDLGSESLLFMKKKVLAIFPAHLIAFAITFVMACLANNYSLERCVKFLFDALPSLFFLNKLGIPCENVISVEWYISAMLISMAVIYPVARKHRETFIKIVAPTLGLLITGYVAHKFGSFRNPSIYDVFTYKCVLRAIAELLLGMFAFYAADTIKSLKLTRVQRIIMTIVEWCIYVGVIGYAISNFKPSYDFSMMLALAIAVTISFSGISYGGSIWNNDIVYFLGKISLPIYLVQNALKNLIDYKFHDASLFAYIAIYVGGSVILGIIVYYIARPLGRYIDNAIGRMTAN